MRAALELVRELWAMLPRDGRRIVALAHRADAIANTTRLLLLAVLIGSLVGLAALPEVRWVS